jgi:hypothetical protein
VIQASILARSWISGFLPSLILSALYQYKKQYNCAIEQLIITLPFTNCVLLTASQRNLLIVLRGRVDGASKADQSDPDRSQLFQDITT